MTTHTKQNKKKEQKQHIQPFIINNKNDIAF